MRSPIEYFFLFLWTTSASLFAPPTRVAIERPIDPVMPLRNEAGQSICTGFVIGQDLIATAAHCVDGPLYVELSGALVQLIALRMGEPGTATDVAILQGPTGTIAPFELADEDTIGSCYFYGFAGSEIENMMPCVLFGDVGDGVIGGRGQVRPGDSGGPVLGQDQRVIGVVFAGNLFDEAQLYVAPVSSLKALIPKAQ